MEPLGKFFFFCTFLFGTCSIWTGLPPSKLGGTSPIQLYDLITLMYPFGKQFSKVQRCQWHSEMGNAKPLQPFTVYCSSSEAIQNCMNGCNNLMTWNIQSGEKSFLYKQNKYYYSTYIFFYHVVICWCNGHRTQFASGPVSTSIWHMIANVIIESHNNNFVKRCYYPAY